MKKLIFPLAVSLFLYGCKGNGDSVNESANRKDYADAVQPFATANTLYSDSIIHAGTAETKMGYAFTIPQCGGYFDRLGIQTPSAGSYNVVIQRSMYSGSEDTILMSKITVAAADTGKMVWVSGLTSKYAEGVSDKSSKGASYSISFSDLNLPQYTYYKTAGGAICPLNVNIISTESVTIDSFGVKPASIAGSPFVGAGTYSKTNAIGKVSFRFVPVPTY